MGAVCLISAIAVITDITRGKIYNWLTLPALMLGLVWSFWNGGFHGAGLALAGAGIALVGYGALFAFGILGGGDVKLLMALGAWGGPRFAIEVALLSVVLGGALSLLWLTARGRLPAFVARLRRFMLSVLVRPLEPEPLQIDRSVRMPYGIAIAGSAVWILFGNPLLTLGVRLW